MADRLGQKLLHHEDIARRVAELGAAISRDTTSESLVCVGILKGAVVFLADLARAITVPCTFDFMAVSSYGLATRSSGVVRIVKDLDISIEDRDVLIVEDIIDTGLTLQYLAGVLVGRHPASLRICTLLDKPDRRQVPVDVNYTGFAIPDRFVVGYGLDYQERYRNLADVWELEFVE